MKKLEKFEPSTFLRMCWVQILSSPAKYNEKTAVAVFSVLRQDLATTAKFRLPLRVVFTKQSRPEKSKLLCFFPDSVAIAEEIPDPSTFYECAGEGIGRGDVKP